MKDNKDEKKRLSLRVIVYSMMGIALILSVLMLVNLSRVSGGYTAMLDATEKYISGKQDASDLQAGSDYLTEQVRFFAISGERLYLDNYFTELEVTKRRDRAVENIERVLAGSGEEEYLKKALSFSNDLVSREYYSMRLMIDAMGYDIADFPESINETVIKDRDKALSSDEKKELAQSMVFDSAYHESKNKINENTTKCIEALNSSNMAESVSARENLRSLLATQRILEAILLAAVLAVAAMTLRLVLAPIRKNISMIQQGERLPEAGVHEMQFLARAYNRMYDQNAKSHIRLSYEATHDALTGLYNRAAFSKEIEEEDWENVAFLAVDVDEFKTINDTFGHAMGDRVLRRVANALKSTFRSEDYICRMGGDEFSVVMMRVGPELKELIEKKIAMVVSMLAGTTEDGVPPVTLSIGVAFGDWMTEAETICNNADIALYRVKNAGRNGHQFF